jgi:hypothetical protein
MAARILKPRTSLVALLGELRYTLSRFQANPLTAAFVPTFQALRDAWTPVSAQEIGFQEAASDAQALVDEADDGVDDFSSRVSKVILTITKDDREDPLYLHFFGSKSLSAFRKPVLGAQLDTMRNVWLDALTTSPHPELQTLAPELTKLIAAADEAIGARDDARALNRKFHDIGERRQLFDQVNAERKAAHGAIAKLALTTSGLPSDFADHFFRVDSAAPEPTIDDVTQNIADLEAELAAEKIKLAALHKAADDAAKALAEKQADEAALDALEKQAAELQKQQADLKKKLGKE